MKHEKTVHIMLIEDNDNDARLVEHWCRKLPFLYHISRVITLKEALDNAQSAQFYDLVIFDIRLIDNNSIWGIRPVVQALPDVPIFIFTGGLPEWHDDAIHLGASIFAMKHEVDEEKFRDLILKVLHKEKDIVTNGIS